MNIRFRLAKRGAIFLIKKFLFPNEIKPKYCLLMEDITPDQEPILVILATSNVEKRYNIPASVKIKLKQLPETSLIELYNYHEIDAEVFLDEKRSEYICMLPYEYMDEVNRELKNFHPKSQDIWIRMQPNEED